MPMGGHSESPIGWMDFTEHGPRHLSGGSQATAALWLGMPGHYRRRCCRNAQFRNVRKGIHLGERDRVLGPRSPGSEAIGREGTLVCD